jgi:hypothetical protein
MTTPLSTKGTIMVKTFRIIFEKYSKQFPNRMRIDNSNMPSKKGVYIIKFKNKQIKRLWGQSKVIKIGYTDDLHDRIRQYNQKNWVTDSTEGKNISSILKQQIKGRTDAHVILLLHRLSKEDQIVLTFHEGISDKYEKESISEYLGNHGEVPPLNLARQH